MPPGDDLLRELLTVTLDRLEREIERDESGDPRRLATMQAAAWSLRAVLVPERGAP